MSSDDATRILIIEPDSLGPPDRFAAWFRAAGAEVKVVRPHLGEPVPARVEAEALLVMGGRMNALADREYRWLSDIRRIYVDAVDAGLPVLGICLGAQLLATTFGGDVEVSSPRGPEMGLVDVEWTKDGIGDPLTAGLSSPFTACASHSDGVAKLPPEAILLGTGQVYPHQVFRIGSAVGVQFHPETTPSRFNQWCQKEVSLSAEGSHVLAAKIREFEARDTEVERSTRLLADRFLAAASKSLLY